MQPSRRSLATYARIVCSGLVLTLFVVADPLWMGSANGDLRYTTAYRENPIRGSTPAQLWRHMLAHPIMDEDGPALANITHDHKLSVKTKRSGGVCRVDELDFTWRFVITLPKAVDRARMNATTRAMWREFTDYLRHHEEHHRAIFIDCGNKFLAKASKLTGSRSCFLLKRKVQRFIDEQYDACMVRQRAYDRKERARVARLALRRAAKE